MPLATVLHDNFICNNTKEANTDIIRGLIDAGANLLKSNNTDTYVWKGKGDLMFCVPKGDSNTLLVAPKVTTKMNDGTYRICCLLKQPPECQLYSIAKLGTDLPENLLERVLKFPCIQMHKILLTNNHCNLTSKMSDGTPCMHYIVEYGSHELVEFMFDRGISSIIGTNVNKNTDFSLLDESRNSILHTAIRKRKTDNVVVIMKRCFGKPLNVMLDTQNISKETPLDLAIKEKLFSLIPCFNLYRPEIFCTNDNAENSWFHRAVKDKNEELLRVLTSQDNLANYIDSENAKQYTPLMLSVRDKFVAGFKILKETKKCRINVHNTEGYTLLHLAIIYYEKEIFSELLQVIVSDNQSRQMIDRPVNIPTIRSIPSSQYHGLTPLLLSLRCQQFVAARLLLENGANINKLDCEGRTFNSYLIETCRDENELDSFTKKVNCIHNDVSSLSMSVQYSNESVFDLLISKCDLDMIAYQDDSQNTVLSLILSDEKYTRFLKPLLSRLDVFYQDETKKAKLSQIIDKQNKKGETPLTLLILLGNPESVGKLLALGCNVTKDKVATLLNLAIKHGEGTFETVFEHFRKKEGQLLKKCLEIGPPEIPHCVIHSINHTNLLALTTLIEYNKSYKNIIYGNLPLLHYAITKQFVDGVKYLISLGLPLATHNSEQILTLHSDTLKLRLIITDSKVGYKLGNGYVLTDISNFERTEYCSGITEVKNITLLFQNLVLCKISEPLQQYISIHKSLLPSCITQLSLTSSKYATSRIMEYLLNSKDGQKCIFDVNSTESDGNTVVHNGIYNSCIQSLVLLLNHLDKINTDGWIFAGTRYIDQLNKQKYSPLELSMKEYKKEAFLTLRQHGASYSTKGSGQNILHRYITCNITDISYLDLILEDLSQQKSEIINEYNSTGYTPLHTAVNAGNTLVYSKLMALPSCNYDIVSKSERNNIVHLVIQKNSPELLKLILEDLKNREKDKNDENRLINRENAKQLTPQFLAVEEGNVDLILNMPEFSGVGADGTNLLHHAVKCSDKSPRHLEMIKTIITKKEGMINAGDKSNETPLHYAVKLSRESALKELLEYPSIDFSCQNNNGMTALHLAIYSNTNILKLMLNAIDKLSEPSKIINMQDKEGKTALHHCIESTVYNKERLSLLLARNPDLQLFDSKSNNILHYAANCKVELLKALITHIKEKSPDCLNCLLSKRNEEHNTPLYCAIQMKNIPCVDEFLKINATLPVIRVDGTVTLCNKQPFPHTKVPMCLYDVKLKDKPDLHICVGFELSDKQWILSDLPKLSCTYLTPLIPLYSQSQRVSKIPNIGESLLKSNLLACHCYEPLELVIAIVKDRKFINEARLMHLAASCGTIQIVEYLIEFYGADVPFSDLDNKRYSIIHYSIENKETKLLRILCERMKRDHPQDFTELSGKLLQFCITKDHFEAFKILLEKQYSANVAYTDTHGDTLLHLIVLHSRDVGYVTELLKCPQLVASEFCNNVNKNFNTGLHLAINKKDRILVTEILKHSSDISIHDSNDNTALHLAIQNSTIDIIRDIMVFRSMNINVKKPDTEVSILLNLAIKRGEKTFQTVFEHFRQEDGQFLKNCLEIIPSEIPHCVIHSINHTNLLALTTLIEYNESYKNIIYGNLPLLHYAITKQFVDGVKYLISLGLPLATHNSEQILTLHSDTLKLRLAFTESKVGYKLGNGYILTDIPNFERTEYCSGIITVRNIYVLFQNLVLCKITEPLQQYISIHKTSQSSYIAQLSMISSKHATLQIMEFLLNSKYFFDVDSTDNDGNTVVHNGIYNPCIQSFDLLLNYLDKINTKGWFFTATKLKHIDRLNNQKHSPLELSMKESKKEAFLTLRQHGASYATKGSGQNILHRYITCNITDISYLDLILEDLSQQKSEIINEYNSTGYTPLHTAVSAGNTPVYNKLMALPSCNYDIVSKSERNNIVHLVIQKNSPELLKLILEDLKNREKDKNDENRLINRENAKQLTPQFLAVEEGNVDLILNMPEFSGVSADGTNLLHHAVKCSDKSPRHLEMIKTIITKKEGMINAGDKSNETPLHYAVKLSRESALKELLECPSIDFSCQNNNGMTALHLAIHSNTNILELLFNAIDKLSEPSKIINMQDKEGKTALHHCIKSTVYNKERLSLLLARNPDLQLFDSKSNNILHYAANCKVELLKALITHIKEKSPDCLNCLLSKRNEENNTPLYCAIQMKNIPCVDEFLKINATLPVKQEDGTVTLCNKQPFPHTKVPMCLYDVKLKDKLDSHICVGFELSDKQWILSDLPKLSCTYLTPVIHNHSQYQHVSKIPNDSIDESLLKSNLLACHCYEPLELVIDIVKDLKFTNEASLMHLAASCGTIQIVEYLIELYRADIPFLDLDNKGYSILHYSIENTERKYYDYCARE